MDKRRDISVVVNSYNNSGVDELRNRKARIAIKILKEKYGGKILKAYIDSMRGEGY